MTDAEVKEAFDEAYPIETFYSGGETIDYIARREAFNNYTDMLCKDGLITDEQYHEMDNPY